MPDFYSHAKKESNGTKVGSKLLARHTKGVRDKALNQIHDRFGFRFSENYDLAEILNIVCLYHDLGKYTSYFQDYLLGKPFDQTLKQHARFGAHAILQRYGEEKTLGLITYLIVKNHHRNLNTPDSVQEDKLIEITGYDKVKQIFQAQCESISAHLDQIETELEISGLQDELALPNKKRFYRFVKDLKERPDIQHYFLINYLFSLLIEADKLDASDTELYQRIFLPATVVSDFIAGLSGADTDQNRLRNQVRAEVLQNLEEKDVTKKRLFLLTAPTGIGKTLTALDFAIRLRDKLPNRPQIIVGLPFINIIEQTLDVYQQVLSETDAKVLGHYQYADVFGDQEDPRRDEEKDYNRRRMELDTWQSDIVVTSFVQLLQTMISNRNKLLLKFNHLAGAIVIMDEVQSLRLEQTPLIGAVLYYMSKYLDTRFVLMTATKPLIFELAEKHLLNEDNEHPTTEVTHLLPDPRYFFQQFHRTQIIPLHLSEKLPDTDSFIQLLQKHWSTEKSCLIVCNTVNRSIEIFEKVKEAVGNHITVHYLSTNVLPLLRLEIIEQIKKDLQKGNKSILISTQVVEAGVDLDFDMGFRDLGPIDSIVQVAGRINRENSPERKCSPLYVFDLGDCQRIYGAITEAQAKLALGQEPIPEPAYFDLVEKYFWNISDRNAYDYSEKLFRGLKYLQYSEQTIQEPVIPVWKFRVIEESPHVASVFVDWDERGRKAREAYLEMLSAPNRETGFQLKAQFDKDYKRDFHQRIISVPDYYTDGLPSIDPERPEFPVRWISRELQSDWYVLPTGFNRRHSPTKRHEKDKAWQL